MNYLGQAALTLLAVLHLLLWGGWGVGQYVLALGRLVHPEGGWPHQLAAGSGLGLLLGLCLWRVVCWADQLGRLNNEQEE